MRLSAAALWAAFLVAPASALPSFPGAEGFGAETVGGRGGAVYIVSNLSDTGMGSLRACVDAIGPRTCVFRTSGTIAVATPILVKSPFLTIAGQTSPAGIALKITAGNKAGPFQINAHDVIIRHIRFRPGPSSMTSSNNDGLLILSGVYNVMIDHCSFSWATDELINTVPASEGKPSPERITVQWSMAYEGLSKSTHLNGEHSRGPYFESKLITMHHTLIASNQQRNPNLNLLGQFDMFNDVIYNAVERFTEVYDVHGPVAVNAIGNWTSMGPSSIKGRTVFGFDAYPEYRPNEGGGYGGPHGYKLYVQNNIGPRIDGSGYLNPNDVSLTLARPIGVLSMQRSRITSPQQAFLDTLAFAGAFPRDSSDVRVAAYVRGCKGAKINNPSEVGGWPVLSNGLAPADNDQDGMADAWEKGRGVSDRNADDDGDGYTNLEEYLSEIAGDGIDRLGAGKGFLPPLNCGYGVR
jgi:pectate lyase